METRQRTGDGRGGEGNDKAQKGATPTAPRRETLLNERRFNYFSRSFTLPPSVSTENVAARVEDGVLYLTLNKREETKPRKIEVR